MNPASPMQPRDLKILRMLVSNGHLYHSQTDATTRDVWASQHQTCPCCQDQMGWHRGVILEFEKDLVWVCLLCAAVEAQNCSAPLPPDLQIIWIARSLLPAWTDRPTTIQVTRHLGAGHARTLYQGGIERSPHEFRFTQPEEHKQKEFIAALLPRSPFHRPDPMRPSLRLYFDSEEERNATKIIHDLVNPRSMWGDNLEPLDDADLPVVHAGLISVIPQLNSIERRESIPRVGITSNEGAEVLRKSGALVEPEPNNMCMYLIPWRHTKNFYGLPPDELHRFPEFVQLGCPTLFYDSPGRLWQRAFGWTEDSDQ